MGFNKIKDRLRCNKPTRSPKKNKTKMVKACQGGKEKLLHFGDPDMPIKKHLKKNKKSYCARSAALSNLKDKLTPNYWSRREWEC